MNGKLFLYALISIMGFLTARASAQEFDDEGETGAYGYTTIYYDPTTNVVTAYAETELYGNATYFYQAQVLLSSNGNWSESESPNPTGVPPALPGWQ